MKKQWLPLVFAVFLMLAPVASASDGSSPGWLDELVDQIVALLSGDELGPFYPPYGAAQPSGESDLGEIYPPYGATGSGDEQELGLSYPPYG